jgi:hypothetical protein
MVGGLARVKVNHQQTAEHAHPVVMGKRAGKGNTVCHLAQVGLVLWPDALAQFLVIGFINQYEAE